MPGAGGGGAITPPVSLAYSGGFNPASARINFITTLTLGNGTQLAGSETGFAATAYTLDASGGMTAYTRTGGTTRTSGTTTVADVSGNADALIGRWNNGTNTGANPFTLTANQGFHYALVRPVAADFTLPTQGRIDFELLSATRPTIVDGSVAPGTITADMAILLGSPLHKVAFEAQLTMPGAGGGANAVRSYATTGGLANPSQSSAVVGSVTGGNFFFSVPGVAGTNCQTANCEMSISAVFAGDSDTVGMTYSARNDEGDAKVLIGAALFGNGTLTGAAPTSTLLNNQALAYANRFIGTDSYANAQVRYDDATGAPVGFIVSNDEQAALGTAQVAQYGNAGTTLYWSRWNSGTPTGTYFGDLPGAIGANGSYHLISGTPATTRPASGTVNYALVGSTAPTFQDERTTAGTMTGSAAVAFGTTPRLGLSLDVAIGGQTYNVATAGGVATPSSSAITIAADNTFDSPFGSLTVTSASSFCTPTCSAFVDGFLAGTNASHMGLAYAIRNNSNPQTFIDGTAAFAASAGGGGGSGTPGIIVGDQLNQHTVTANYAAFQDIYANVTGYAPSGIIETYRIGNGSTWTRAAAQAPAAEAGSVAGAMGWARWTSGTTQNGTLSANQGTHIISGTPATALPTTGTVQYQMIGATKPTDGDGATTPGTFNGSMAVDFATRKVGLNFAITLGQFAWNLSTTGGTTTPSSSSLGLSVNNQVKDSVIIIGTTPASCLQACTASVDGFLFGPGASHFGITYAITDRQTPSNLLWVSGAAAFAAGSGLSGTVAEPAAQATTLALAAAPEPAWDRWEAGAGSSAMPAPTGAAPGIDAALASGVQFSPEQLLQLEAYYAAQNRTR
jgi:hypothetical protein